jgi:phage repressor protein C with HTH and peptisase S24 domain
MEHTHIGKRFTEALHYLKRNMIIRAEKAILEDTDYGSSTLSEIKKGRQQPSQEILDILDKKFRINTDWIMRGEGEMLKEPNGSPEKIDLNQTIIKGKEKKVPLFDAHASAGNEYTMDLAPVTHPSSYIALGDLLSSDSQAAMYVFGSSMTPNYPSGCIIGLRLNLDGIIQPGEVYVVETDSNRYFKRLYYNEENTGYTCISDNAMTFETGARKGRLFYEPFDIVFGKVRRLFDVTGVIKRNQNSAIMSKAS